MPFDIGYDTDPSRRKKYAPENPGSEFVPDWGLIRPDVMLQVHGTILGMIWLPGLPFELEGMATRNIQRRQLIDLWRSIADDNVTLAFSLVNHKHTTPFRWDRFRTRFAERVMRRYEAACLNDQLMHKDWFVTVLIAPRFVLGTWFKEHIGHLRRHPAPKAGASMIQQLDSAMTRLMSYLAPFGARRLGVRRSPRSGLLCSEIVEARRLLLYGEWQEVPLTTGSAGRAIYNERIKCGSKFIRLEHAAGPRFAKTLSIFDYPAGERDETTGKIIGGTYTGQTSRFLQMRDNFPFVVSQTFKIDSRATAASRLYLKHTRMSNALSVETRQLAGIQEARQDIAGGDKIRGEHSFSFTVFGDTPPQAADAAGIASAAMVDAGLLPIIDDGNTFSAFWLGLPGQVGWLKCRTGNIDNANLAALAPLEGFPLGDARGFWGPPVIRLRTLGRTGYDWQPFVGQIGHALILGRSDSGKTFLATLLACALEQYDGTVIILDKDEGTRPFVHACGGSYFGLRAGRASGTAPLMGLANTPEDIAFLTEWFGALIMSDGRGPLQTFTPEQIRRAVTRQMRLPPDKRSIAGVRAMLGFGDAYDGDRLQRWTRYGDRGWIFDNDEDEIRLDAKLMAIDLTELLDHAACPYVAAYLIHRIRKLIDGRKLTVLWDEVRASLQVDVFADLIEDFSLRLRKLNGELWLLAQAPEHITRSKTGLALAQQAQTIWAYPARNASREEFCDKLNFSIPMYKALTETMPTLGHRSVMMWREKGSAIFNIDLSALGDDLLLMSGRKETNNFIPEILAEIGEDHERFADAFIARATGYYTRQRQLEHA